MGKEKVFNIRKDFGYKKLEKVFVRDDINESEDSLLLKEKIENSLCESKTVYIVAEKVLTDELMTLLIDVHKKTGIRIYILIKKIKEEALEYLKNSCIVIEVSNISGDYLLCDDKIAYFFNNKLKGYAVHNKEKLDKLKQFFIYKYWNEAEKEFITKTKTVVEKTFDVAPVLVENDDFIPNREAVSEKSPYKELLEKSDSFIVCPKSIDFQLENFENNLALYFDKEAWESANKKLLEEPKNDIFYFDSLCLPLCQSNGKWYILNNDFAISMNKGEKPIFTNKHKYHSTLKYNEAVGESLFYGTNFETVEIKPSDNETRSFPCDCKLFKKVTKMNEQEREDFFAKKGLLSSEKLAAKIDFSIKMTEKKRSKSATEAPIYEMYKNFSEDFNKYKNQLNINKNNYESEKEKSEKDLEKINSEIERFKKKEEKYKQNCNDLNDLKSKIKGLQNDISANKAESAEFTKKVQSLEQNLSKLQKEKKEFENKEKGKDKKLSEQLNKENEKLEKLNSKLGKLNDFIAKLEEITKDEYKTVAEYQNVVKVCQNIEDDFPKFVSKNIPSFDKPMFGMLYKTNTGYEYELKNADEDLEKAEKEMDNAKLKKVEFVSYS